jgi:hypothetical protein
MGLAELYPGSRTVTVDGFSIEVRPLKLREIGGLDAFLIDCEGDPVARAEAIDREAIPEPEYKAQLREAYWEIERLTAASEFRCWGMDLVRMGYYDRLIGMACDGNSPPIAPSARLETVDRLGIAGNARLVRIAMDVDPRDAIERLIYGPPGSEGSREDAEEAVYLLATKLGGYGAVGEMTMGQFRSALREGKPRFGSPAPSNVDREWILRRHRQFWGDIPPEEVRPKWLDAPWPSSPPAPDGR